MFTPHFAISDITKHTLFAIYYKNNPQKICNILQIVVSLHQKKKQKQQLEPAATDKRQKIMKTTVAKRIEFQTNRKSQETGERIYLFRDMDFYFMYNEDAEIVSNILGINKSTAIDNDFSYTVFHANKLDQYLQAIIRHGHRVAIVDNLF